MGNYVIHAIEQYSPAPDENVLKSIFSQYERVIIESLISSFGLDFLIEDKYGGDVDTIHNVREIGKDPEMKYKNKANASDYDNRGDYSAYDYHSGNLNYKSKVKSAKERFNTKGEWTQDEYVKGNRVAYNKALPNERRAELDHVIAAKKIHDDRGRVLADIDGADLANSDDNLVFTNRSLNNNMREKNVEEYIQWCEENPEKINYNGKKGEPLPEDVKDRLRKEYNQAKKSYESKIARVYYTSPKFAKDLSKAAVKSGAKMGIKQALGFVFAEIWFAVKEEFVKIDNNLDLNMNPKLFLKSIGNGVKRGFENAKLKYKELFERFLSGTISGVLSSVTTTICNVFFTTAKNTVKILRLSYASLVQAAKILFLNPEAYSLGEQMRAAAKIFATGASVIVGTLITEAISKTPIGNIPVVGGIASNFCGALVTGIFSCTLLYFFDRDEYINRIVRFLNSLPTIENNVAKLKHIGEELDNYAANLMKINIVQFKNEVNDWNNVFVLVEESNSEEELNQNLKTAMKTMHIKLPWSDFYDSFDSFMKDDKAVLKFE